MSSSTNSATETPIRTLSARAVRSLEPFPLVMWKSATPKLDTIPNKTATMKSLVSMGYLRDVYLASISSMANKEPHLSMQCAGSHCRLRQHLQASHQNKFATALAVISRAW
jgi:hypothetical protein